MRRIDPRPAATQAEPTSLMGWVRRMPQDRQLTVGRSAGRLCADVDRLAATLDVAPGEPVGFRWRNDEQWVLGLLGLLTAGARVVLAAPDTPDAEFGRLCAKAGAGRELVPDGEYLAGPPATPTGPGIVLGTSGSTGEPSVVVRSERSLVAEALRFRGATGLGPSDRVLLPLPLSHAYALGWLAAALVCGAELRPLPPTALSALARELADGATVLALVPSLTRLLVARAARRPVTAPELRLTMIGAGPVDAALERSFRDAFGAGTGRNYGSTETGALFCGITDLPPLCVGTAMPGVSHRVVGGDEVGAEGWLQVRLDDVGESGWRDTGDLAVEDAEGRVRIVGRRYSAVRRGSRWVSPLEIESVLGGHPGVTDVAVRARRGRAADEDVLVADLAVAEGVDGAAVLAFARANLVAYKVPDQVNLYRRLERDRVGKRSARPRRYRLGDERAVVEALRAHRRSALVLALDELGLLSPLRGGADVDELATDRGLPAEQVAWLLDTAVRMRLVEPVPADDTGGAADDRPSASGLAEQIRLERELTATWLTSDAVADAVRKGRGPRAFDEAEPRPELLHAYRDAMHGPHTSPRTRLGVRLLGLRSAGRVLEVSAGPGRYLDAVRDGHTGSTLHLLRLGRLGGPTYPHTREITAAGALDGGYDAVIVANGVHRPGRGADLDWLAGRLAPGGALLVDDVFLPEAGGPGSELALDWLTHGGIAWAHFDRLAAGLSAAGMTVRRTIRLDPPECRLVLAELDAG